VKLSDFKRELSSEDTNGDLEHTLSEYKMDSADNPEAYFYILIEIADEYTSRYEVSGSEEDLNRAIQLFYEAKSLLPEDSPNLPTILACLANGLKDRYYCTKDLNDLNGSIDTYQKAVALSPDSSSNLPGILSNLGNALSERSANKGNLKDTENAINAYLRAIGLLPKESPDLPKILNNLGMGYRDRYNITEDLSYLEEAIKSFESAARIVPKDSPILSTILENLKSGIEGYQKVTNLVQKDSTKTFGGHINGLSPQAQDRLQSIRQEISQLNTPNEIPHRIQLLQEALTLVTREQDSTFFWASLHALLAVDFMQNIFDSRSDNIEQAIKHCNKAFEVFTQEEFPRYWAENHNTLAIAYENRTIGDPAENIEHAIIHYNEFFKVFEHETSPEQWASAKNNLAGAYIKRIKGVKADNIEMAIQNCEDALTIRRLKPYSPDWAMTQNVLASAYSESFKEDRAENLEKAIFHYKEALKVYSLDHFPEDWATIQHNLAKVFIVRTKGKRAENIEEAINYLTEALKVRTSEKSAADWALTQNYLAIAYYYRIKGDPMENKEQAIFHYSKALEIYTLDSYPKDWAMIQNNLGEIYRERIKGDPSDNIETAIRYFNESLKVYKKNILPFEWAGAHNNLAITYSNYIRKERADDIERSIGHAKKALAVYKKNDFQEQWAMVQHNLGILYSDRIKGDHTRNKEQAIEHLKNALKARTTETFPDHWAMTQHSLGRIFFERIKGDRDKNIIQSCRHYNDALKVFHPDTHPEYCRNTALRLGHIYFSQRKWSHAYNAYKIAMEAGEILYQSGISEESRSHQTTENKDLYGNASFAIAQMGNPMEALLTLERGKTRLLAEALHLKVARPNNVPDEVWSAFIEAGRNLRAIRSEKLGKESIHNPVKAYVDRETMASKSAVLLQESIKDIHRYAKGFLEALSFQTIETLLPNEYTALIAFSITSQGSLAFIVSGDPSSIKMIDLPNLTRADLDRLFVKFDSEGLPIGGWLSDYANYLGTDEQYRNNAFAALLNSMNSTLEELGRRLILPLITELASPIKHIIFLPSGPLFLLPLHAIPINECLTRLCDLYRVSYAPSAEILADIQTKIIAKRETKLGEGLYTVINPEEDPALVFSGCEGQTISQMFQSKQVDVGFTGTRATVLDAIPGKAYLHFSCHGSYNWDDPRQSGLFLYGGRTLSLVDLQSDEIDMSSTRLVTLSACETGIIDVIKGSAEEFVGLPAGFMLAGVPCVVSSLWSVSDISTALLMERFYSNHLGGIDIPSALQEAQTWVRDFAASQVAEHVERCYSSGKWEGKSKQFIEMYRERYLKMARESPDMKPFEHPYYWAAFTVNGA
jgi:CHAT domain-containing protein/tetratricopeptide (TPR) repeat protein